MILSIIYLVNLQINTSLRLFNSVKSIPYFYREVQKDRRRIVPIIVTYYLKTLFLSSLSLFIIIRMIFNMNEFIGMTYIYSLFLGFFLSIYFVYYSERFKELNFNVKKESIFVYLLGLILIIFYIYFVPLFFHIIVNNPEFMNKYLYNTQVKYMFPNNSPSGSNDNNINEIVNRNVIKTPDNSNSPNSNNTGPKFNRIDNKNEIIISDNVSSSSSERDPLHTNNRSGIVEVSPNNRILGKGEKEDNISGQLLDDIIKYS